MSTYSGTFHQWFRGVVVASRILPTIWQYRCNVSLVARQSARRSSGSVIIPSPQTLRFEVAPAPGVLCGFDLLPGWANAHEGMGGNGRGDTGEQAPEGVRAVAGQFHLVGNLLEGGLDPVAPFSDDLLQDRWHAAALVFGGRDQHSGAPAGLGGDECLAVESLVCEQVSRRRPGLQQVAGDVALVDRGGHDAPGPNDPAAEVGLDGQPEAVEPLGMRAVAAEAGHQAARPGPEIGATDPGGVLDRQRGRSEE